MLKSEPVRMYSVEFEMDSTVITVLDEQDKFEDVEVIIGDDNAVFIRQWDEAMGIHQLVYLSYQQLLDMYLAMHSTEGLFKAVLLKDV